MQTPAQTAKTATLCPPFITRCRPLGDTRLCERVDVRLVLIEALLSILHPSRRDGHRKAQTLTLGPITSADSGSKAKATYEREIREAGRRTGRATVRTLGSSVRLAEAASTAE